MKRWHLTIALAVLAAGGAWLAHRARVASPVLIGFLPTATDARLGALNTKIGTASLDFVLRTDPRIAACFADARAHIGRLPDVVVRVHLRPNGTADSVMVVDPDTLTGTGLAMCLTTTIETMGFFVPDDATARWVTYRFEGS
jgi:hypothetical protein